MKDILDWLNSPLGGAIAFFAFSSAARALPEPLPCGSRFYLFIFNFSHSLLSNWDKVRGGKPVVTVLDCGVDHSAVPSVDPKRSQDERKQ